MKGWRFYQVYEDGPRGGKKSGEPLRECIAINLETAQTSLQVNGCYEGFSAIFFEPNSAVCYGGISPEYLELHCKRVSESVAREAHPRLLERLDRRIK